MSAVSINIVVVINIDSVTVFTLCHSVSLSPMSFCQTLTSVNIINVNCQH